MREVRIPIRWRDLDAYGHVNNAVFLTYLEEARDAWVQEVLGAVTETWDFVLARVEIDYRRELRQEDEAVVVRCDLVSFGRSSVRTREQIVTLDGTVAADAASVIVPRDPSTGRARQLGEQERSVLERELPAEAGTTGVSG
jgi:acyl-CoA thioester hydrolase